ncbi:hypothetical protein ACFV1W_30000 [Kitasatospora sp. NPDC059648]|uniref:hypothetical protein n=1 Tax=Kitasatospora sp. NPDC059648 TaxID=3346894 RepID=UPI0036B6E6C5
MAAEEFGQPVVEGGAAHRPGGQRRGGAAHRPGGQRRGGAVQSGAGQAVRGDGGVVRPDRTGVVPQRVEAGGGGVQGAQAEAYPPGPASTTP